MGSRVAVLWVGKVVLLGLVFMFECFILQEAVLRVEAYDHGWVYKDNHERVGTWAYAGPLRPGRSLFTQSYTQRPCGGRLPSRRGALVGGSLGFPSSITHCWIVRGLCYAPGDL